MTIRIQAEPVTADDLEEGDLYHVYHQAMWDQDAQTGWPSGHPWLYVWISEEQMPAVWDRDKLQRITIVKEDNDGSTQR